MKPDIFESKWEEQRIIVLECGEYSAQIIPGIGANAIGLKKGDINIFRKIAKFEDYKEAPAVYGMPILFPPNRIDQGKFEMGGKEYQFPLNEVDRQNSLHGFLQDQPFDVVKMESNDHGAKVVLRFEGDEQTQFYKYFPHHFVCQITYSLSEEGLLQKIEFENKGEDKMPLALGFHTAFDLSFGGNPEKVRMKLSVDKRVPLNERALPTGELKALSTQEIALRKEGLSPLYADMDDHFTAKEMIVDGQPFHGAILEDVISGAKIIYEVGASYKHWMVWNCDSEGSFVCPEPQTWRVNAPNIDGSDDELGIYYVEPFERFSEYTKVYCI